MTVKEAILANKLANEKSLSLTTGNVKYDEKAEDKQMNVVDNTLKERSKTHGDFALNAYISQSIKDIIKASPKADNLSMVQLEALGAIVGKIARICSGNPNEPDHWLDIAGYATLALNIAGYVKTEKKEK